MRSTLILLAALAACGKVSSPGGGGDADGGGGGGGDGGDQPDANPITELSVTLDVGTGGGTVVSDVGDIDCGSSCEATLDTGTEVTFTATPDAGSAFVAWRGLSARDCRRATECTVTLTGGPQEVGALFAEKGTAAWALQIGSSVGDGAPEVIVDKNGDLFMVDSFGGGFEFAGTSYDNAGQQDIFVAKLSPGGEVIWAKAFGGEGYDTPAFIAADPTSGDLVLGGFYTSAVDFGGDEPLAIADTEDLFVVKLAAGNGDLVWQKPIEVSDNDGPGFEGLAVDGNGRVLVLGHFNSSINLGGADLTDPDQSMFLARLKADDGALDWQRKLGGSNYPIPRQMIVDSAGNPIIVGYFSDVADFDGAAGNDMTALGLRDAFIVKFAAGNGSMTWQRQIGGNEDNDGGGDDEGQGIALGPNNSVVVVMSYRVMTGQPVEFLGNNLAGSGTGVDLVVGRISSAGGFVWAKRFGGAGQEYGYKVATFEDGRVAVTGNFNQTFTIGGDTLTFVGSNYDSFFGLLAANNGNPLWGSRVGSPIQDSGSWVAGVGDQFYGAGSFADVGSFLGKELTSVGSTDGYVFVLPLP
ncbi:MAG TPA: hypothetical protein VIG06_31130 [Kofleriaceae bacterium]|jgi:hypothetical protein